MPEAPYQVVRLSRGRHRSPQYGVCAMELASMLADERFTDHPRRVCPVLAAFLRGYNDAVGDGRRADLFAVAADVVGSRTEDQETREQRAAALQDWAVVAWRARRARVPWPPLFPPDNAFSHLEAVGGYVGRVGRRHPAVHEGTLRLIRELAGAGDDDPTAAVPQANRSSERERISAAAPGPSSPVM